jgi:hypothetical protein
MLAESDQPALRWRPTGPDEPAKGGELEPLSIAVQWVVFSELSTDAMVATGITDAPSTARWMVETILADTSHAGWGEVHRVPVPGEVPSEAELRQWPAPGEVYVCRRSAGGGCDWQPMFTGRSQAAGQPAPLDRAGVRLGR